MRCIDPDQIQKYIDKELTPEEELEIKGHLEHCEACATKTNNQLELATQVKDTINLLKEEPIDIPEFKIPQNREKIHVLTPRRLIYSVAAASILIVFILLFQSKETEAEDNEYFMQLVEQEYDANRSISDQEMVIEIIDPEGNLTEYFFE